MFPFIRVGRICILQLTLNIKILHLEKVIEKNKCTVSPVYLAVSAGRRGGFQAR
jgi:hypothetical protein